MTVNNIIIFITITTKQQDNIAVLRELASFEFEWSQRFSNRHSRQRTIPSVQLGGVVVNELHSERISIFKRQHFSDIRGIFPHLCRKISGNPE